MHVVIPPRVRSPKVVQGIEFALFRRAAMQRWIRRHGRVFEMDVPLFGRTVVVSDPALVRSVCTADAGRLGTVQPNIGNWFGPGSVFALDGESHRDRRRLLGPMFHGAHLDGLEQLVEDETLRESATWPEGSEFRSHESMNRITLNVILRTLFGAEGADGVDRLREFIPRYMTLGQVFAFVPAPPRWARRLPPYRALERSRTAFDRIVGAMIDRATTDPGLEARTDVLAALVRNGIPRQDVCDELLTLVGAGHETVATALAWTFERLRRHPEVLAELVREVDEGGNEYRRATIAEVLRVRTVIDVAGRRVTGEDFALGDHRIPCDVNLLVRIADVHDRPESFAEPDEFDPRRFLDTRPTLPTWLAFGAGSRRCFGAEYAVHEMDVVLRTVLRHFKIETDAARDEKPRFRGVAHVPGRGARVVVHRRT